MLIFIWISCKKDDPSWNVGILTPLLKSSISIQDLTNDSTLITDSTNLLHLVFNRSIYNLSVDSFFSISDTTVSKSFSIDSLRLYNLTIKYPLTLADIARQAGSIGTLLIALHGNTLAIPAIGPLSVPKIDLSVDSIFTSMTLDDGLLDLAFENNLPVDITDVKFNLRNTNNNQIIVQGTFPLIKSKSIEKQTFSLAGQTVESKISVEVTSFSSPGSNGVPVLIDTTNSIVAQLTVYNLRPSVATALWPAQNIIEQYLDFNLRRLSVQLKYAKIKSGKIYLKLISTIDDTLRFKYDLPGATLNGVGFKIQKDLPPGTSTKPSAIYEEYDFAGYDLELSGKNRDTFNATPNSIIVSIDSTGIQKTFSKADNIVVEIGFKDLKPSYARGYLGQDTFDFGPSSVDLDFLKELNGMVNFEDVSMNVQLINNIGTDGAFKVQNISSLNTKLNQKINLSSSVFDQPVSIIRASDKFNSPPITPSATKIKIDRSNSNINSCINILPDKLDYSIQLITNPLGNSSNFNDFIYDGKLLNIDFNLDVPLYLSAENLTLEETQDFNTGSFDLANVIDGKLYLSVDNGFPLDASVQIIFQDESGQSVLEYFKIEGKIIAAEINPLGKVDSKKNSLLSIPIANSQVLDLKKANKVKIKARFDTKPSQQSVKIMDQYSMDMILSADFNYKVN